MLRFVKTVAIYALLGPPLVGIAVAAVAWAYWFATDPNFGDPPYSPLHHVLMLIGYAVPLSYILGGMQAILVGVGSGIWQWWLGRTPLLVPLALSCLGWLGMSVFASSLWQSNGMSFSEIALTSNGAIWLVIHLFAGAVSWGLARRWHVHST